MACTLTKVKKAHNRMVNSVSGALGARLAVLRPCEQCPTIAAGTRTVPSRLTGTTALSSRSTWHRST
jgi:hypothetical protein